MDSRRLSNQYLFDTHSYLRSSIDLSGVFLFSFDSINTRIGVFGIGIRLNNTEIICRPKDERIKKKKCGKFHLN